MAAYDLLTLVGSKHKRLPSAGATVDFLSIKVGASGLEISESTGKLNFNSVKLSGIVAGAATGEAVEYDQLNTALALKQSLSEKGANNGYASLDSGGKVPVGQLPNSVMEYLGNWNATTNTPTLADGTGNAGDVYRTNVSGFQDLGSGSIFFDVGDFAIYSGSVWQLAHAGADKVLSVAGKAGIVTLVAADITNFVAAAKAAAVADAIADGVTDVAPSQNAVFDALALKADTTYVDGKVVDSIADSDTTHAPSRNAVFDALALKSDVTYVDGKVIDSIADSDTTHAPSRNAVFDALALKADLSAVSSPTVTLTNKQGTTISARQVVYLSAAGEVQLAQANGSYTDGTEFYMVKDATIANNASGLFYKAGATVTGFSALTFGAPIYVSRSTGGASVQSLSGFVAGENVISTGKVLSATDVEFNPVLLFEY